MLLGSRLLSHSVLGSSVAQFRWLSAAALGIKDHSLFKTQAYIDGKWVDGASTFPVHNPATGEEIARVPDLGEEETNLAIDAAHKAFQSWGKTTGKERAAILKKMHEIALEHKQDLGRVLTLEQGKPLPEAVGEIAYGASYLDYYSQEATRIHGDVISTPVASRRMIVLKQPVGVCALITPWNFPNAMIARKVAAALAAGCTVVIKPSEDTPLSALSMCEIAERAGVPPGVINVVSASREGAGDIGEAMCTSKIVRKVSFTGSTAVGKLLMAQSASTVKKVSMELGGNAPFIVFEDADVDRAVQGAMASKFRNSGQTCVCANRFFVHNKIYDEFLEKFATAVKGMKVGSGMEQGTEQGPLINERAVDKIQSLVHEAIEAGAKAVVGGEKHSLGGNFFSPTILSNVNENMSICREEIFGPVAPIARFESEEEVLQKANDTPAGLMGYVYTRDMGRAWRMSEGLEYGMVGVNEGVVSSEVAPFGGWKESGVGREGSKYGLDDYLEMKYVCMGV
mmetsp:Transcript_4424/g.6632  ORF Transcript_4424/g.6632 Transcript_4424/m.6632 type:complete len:511 (-) Transcript_4424:67-1599(-)